MSRKKSYEVDGGPAFPTVEDLAFAPIEDLRKLAVDLEEPAAVELSKGVIVGGVIPVETVFSGQIISTNMWWPLLGTYSPGK